MTEAQAAGPTAGTLLRRAREASGLHVAALATSLKVPVRKLEALEADRHDLLPDAVFARALASSVCRTLKVDPQPILSQLPQGPVPRLAQVQEGINAPFRAPSDGPGPSWLEQLNQPVFLAVFALLLGALVLILLPGIRGGDDEPAAAGTSTTAVANAAGPAGDAPAAAVVAGQPAPVLQSPASAPVMTTVTTVASTTVPGATAPAAPQAAAVAAPPAPAASASAAATAPVTGLVVFRTKGPSWIEVTDSTGAVPLRRLLAAGEQAGASGTPPLTVTVGSASDTAVEVRGKPFSLADVARDNVARFEIK